MKMKLRVEIRPVEREDLPYRVQWLNDPSVQGTLSFDTPVSLAKTIRWFEKTLSDPTRRDFTVWHREAESRIGFCGLLSVDFKTRKAEVYVSIGEKSYWGQGIGTEVYQLIEEYSFGELGLERLYLYTLVENLGTQRIMEKLGWIREGLLRRDVWSHGKAKDRLVYGLLRSEWKPR